MTLWMCGPADSGNSEETALRTAASALNAQSVTFAAEIRHILGTSIITDRFYAIRITWTATVGGKDGDTK